MSAKHSLCINRGVVLALLSILTVFPAAAQTTYERVFRRNLWNDSRNVAGLRGDSTSISFAELYGGAEGGDFRLSSEAPSFWNIGTRAIHNAVIMVLYRTSVRITRLRSKDFLLWWIRGAFSRTIPYARWPSV